MSVDPPDSKPSTDGPLPGGPLQRFRIVAVASRLLTDQQLDELDAEVPGGSPTDGDTSDLAGRAKALALLAVKKKWLTKFQARELLRGRRRFTLGQYRILDEIGRGGMGQVFKAEHDMMGRVVAVKVLPRAKSTPDTEAAFQREIRMLARLDHDNLVRALDAGHDGNVYYLVTEYVPGLDLRRQVMKYGPLDVHPAASVISQAARGLAYAHDQGLVHRDVKPGNLLVTREGRVKVLDLGLAGSIFEAESMRLGRCVGTMDYMAPEQIRDPDSVGPAADIYSLGCTLYFAVTGQLPFPGGDRKEKARRHLQERPRPVRAIEPRVSPELARVVEAMMEKAPEDRIASAAEVIGILRPWIPAAPLPMPRPARHPGGTATTDGFPGASSTTLVGTGGSSGFLLGDPAGFAAGPRETVRDAGLQETSDATDRSGPVGWSHEWSESVRGGWGHGWPAPLRHLADASIRIGRLAARSAAWVDEVVDGRGLLKAAVHSLLLAAPVGLAFSLTVHAVSQINPDVARRILREASPSSLGWTAFALVAAVQFLASFGRRGRS